MKRISFILAAAVAGLATFSCVKEQNVPTNVLTEKTVHFGIVAEGTDSKTAVLADESDVIWGGQDELTVLEMLEYTTTDGTVSANNWGSASVTNLTDDGKKAEFDASISAGLPDGATLTSATYVAVYPETKDILKQGGSDPNKFWRVSMPDTQNPEVATFDPKADILLSAPAQKSDLSRVADGDKLPFRFHRIGTAAKMTVKGLTAGEKLKSIVITAPVDVAGLVKVDLTNGGYLDGISTPYSGQGKKVLTLRFSDWVISGDVDVWFRVLPGDWEGTLEIVAETDKAYYYRTEDEGSAITLSTPMQFIDGGRTRFAVNLGTVRVAKADATEFTKVKEQTEIAENVRYIVAYYDPEIDANTAVVMKPISGSNKYTDVKSDVAVSSDVIAIATGEVQVVTLEKATGDNTGDNDYYVLFGEKYLSCGTSNATLTLNTDKPASNGIWTVTPSGIVNTTAINTKNNKAFELQYNNSSPRFANYAGTMKAITLFKNNEAVTPVPVNTITLSGLSEGNKLYLDAVGGVASFTLTTDAAWSTNVNIENGDFSIDPEGDNAAAADQDIEVSADEDNTGAERQMGTITITCGNATETVYVIQRAGASAPAPAGSGTWDDPYNVAKALELIDALANNGYSQTEVYVAGTVTAISDFSVKNTDNPNGYGNASYTIASGNGSVTVFRGKNFNGSDFTDENQLAVNDEVIVYGKLQKYVKNNDVTPEIAQNNYLFARNGEIHLAKPVVTIATDNNAKTITASWNAVDGATSYNVTCGNESKTGLTATSCTFTMSAYGTYDVQVTAKGANGVVDGVSDVKQAELIDPNSGNAPAPAGSGTWEDPYNVAKALELIDALDDGGYSATSVYVAGTVTAISDFSVKNTDNPNGYGNATYTIASGNGSVTVFRGKNFNGSDFTDENQLAVNDEVIVYGKLQKYVDKNNEVTPEIAQNNYLFARNGEIHLAKPAITLQLNHDAKTITANWNAVDGATSYDVTCDTQSKTGLTATSWTFTMSAYGTYDVQVTAKGGNGAVDGVSDVYHATLIDPNAGGSDIDPIVINSGTQGLPTAYGSKNAFDDANLEGYAFKIQQVYVNGQKLQWRAAGNTNGTGTMYNADAMPAGIASIVIEYDSSDNNKNLTVQMGSSANPTTADSVSPGISGTTYTFNGDGVSKYFVITNGSGAGYVKSITINFN